LIAIIYNKKNDFNNLPNLIYVTFNRDIKHSLDIGFNLPVFFYDINEIDSIKEEIIICLIDDVLVINKEKFIDFYNQDKNKKFIFISYTTNYSNIKEIAMINYIKGDDSNDNIIFNILYEIARYFFKVEKLKLFLSYKRNDKTETVIKEFRDFLYSNTKINAFFDVYSIEFGENFEKKIKTQIQDSILISFWSDYYSQSQFCKDEVILAKKYKLPIVVINCLKNKDINAYSYMFNSLVLNCNLSIKTILKEILLEAIRFYNNQKKLKKFKSIYLKDYQIVSKKIEALDLLHYHKILYPDPPVGKYEKTLLKGEFITPNEFFTTLNLNKKIAISVSETDDFQNGLSIKHLQDIVIEIVRFLLLSNNQIIFGGDIKYSLGINFAELIFNLALKYSNKKPAVINPLPRKVYSKIDDSLKAKYIDIIKFQEVSDDLSKMREYMSNIENARIIIGGKLSGYQGKYPGILEEVYYSLKAKKPLYIIGSFGGVAQKIVEFLRTGIEIKEWRDFNIYETIKTYHLNNGLNKEENEILFYSKDVDEILKTIMIGLKKINRK